mgnify:CR=1 FL=1
MQGAKRHVTPPDPTPPHTHKHTHLVVGLQRVLLDECPRHHAKPGRGQHVQSVRVVVQRTDLLVRHHVLLLLRLVVGVVGTFALSLLLRVG